LFCFGGEGSSVSDFGLSDSIQFSFPLGGAEAGAGDDRRKGGRGRERPIIGLNYVQVTDLFLLLLTLVSHLVAQFLKASSV